MRLIVDYLSLPCNRPGNKEVPCFLTGFVSVPREWPQMQVGEAGVDEAPPTRDTDTRLARDLAWEVDASRVTLGNVATLPSLASAPSFTPNVLPQHRPHTYDHERFYSRGCKW